MGDLSAGEILAIQGIAIRRIPFTTTALYRHRGGMALRAGAEIVTIGDRQFQKEVRVNSLGGKYLVSFITGQGATVIFDTKRDGVGDTIESAFLDYLHKGRAMGLPGDLVAQLEKGE